MHAIGWILNVVDLSKGIILHYKSWCGISQLDRQLILHNATEKDSHCIHCMSFCHNGVTVSGTELYDLCCNALRVLKKT